MLRRNELRTLVNDILMDNGVEGYTFQTIDEIIKCVKDYLEENKPK